jgi:amidohydrolase
VLTEADLAEAAAWRRALHREPELSGEESGTAERVRAMLAATSPDLIVTGLGGHGVAAVYRGEEPGPTVMVRAELDALPIAEISDMPHRSRIPDRGHLCGHDGHMATLSVVARYLGRVRPCRGRAVLLFQPAEETGAGAAAILADPQFAALRPDYAFALHNMPGLPLGRAALVAGPAACASRGMRIVLGGRPAHASSPEQGVSPAGALLRLLPLMATLDTGSTGSGDLAMVTLTHLRLGDRAFGIAPGEAEIWLTLRTLTDDRMEALVEASERLVAEVAAQYLLTILIEYRDVFRHCENDPEAVAVLERAMRSEDVPFGPAGLPMRASEDFGRFGDVARAAIFLLGSGEAHPGLHNPDFDYPDALIDPGARVFLQALRELLGGDGRD